jgi:hypothetical protein
MAARRLFGSNAQLTADLLLNPQFDLIQHVRTAPPATLPMPSK